MVHLEFTLHSFSNDANNLRSLVEKCHLTIVEWTVQYDASQPQHNASEMRRSSLVVHCTAEHPYSNDLSQSYRILQCSWVRVTAASETSLSHRPHLLIFNYRAFVRCSEPYHEAIYVAQFSLGTLTWPSQFYDHFKKPAELNFYHDVKHLEIRMSNLTAPVFRLTEVDVETVHMLRLQYSNIREIYVRSDDNRADVYLLLVNPPILYDIEIKRLRRPNRFGERTLEYQRRSSEIPHVLPASIIGKSNMMQFHHINKMDADEIISRLHRRCGFIPVYHVAMEIVALQPCLLPGIFFLHNFYCSYLLEAILRRSFIIQIQNMQVWNEFVASLRSYAAENSEIMEKALTNVLHLMDDGVILDYGRDIGNMFRLVLEEASQKDRTEKYIIPPKTKMVARAVLTPTRLILWPLELMPENRILRNFDADFALRVSFRDDNFFKLSLQASYSREDVFQKAISEPMLQGLTIGTRHFEFLAWSNSQIRDHGVWMYARDKKRKDSASIRSWMGDFSKIRSVSKYMARMGQCFSQTKNSVEIYTEQMMTVRDIERGLSPNGKAYCFSDGIGTISVPLAYEEFLFMLGRYAESWELNAAAVSKFVMQAIRECSPLIQT